VGRMEGMEDENPFGKYPAMDASGIPTPVCPICLNDWLVVPVRFSKETYTIVQWGVEATCYSCKTKLTACTPLDIPDAWRGPEEDDDEY